MPVRRLTTNELVRMLSDLPRNRDYRYVHTATRTQIRIVDIGLPEGPVTIRRYNPAKGQSANSVEDETISVAMLARLADAFVPDQPVNVDRLFGGSYNTRSALEALVAHTPQFYTSYPGRFDSYTGEIKRGHKHLLWMPDEPHQQAVIVERDTDRVISERPPIELPLANLEVPDDLIEPEVDIDIQRQHARIQVALVLIGLQFRYQCWVARNDHHIIYNGNRIVDIDGVIEDLASGNTLISPHTRAVRAAHLIDCIWFGNSRLMPAVMEVEHSTGVTSGLTRMLGLYNEMPAIRSRYVIVAPDEDRQRVVREINREQFESLECKYFPYSSVLELLWLCQHRNLRGVTEDFLDCYFEEVKA